MKFSSEPPTAALFLVGKSRHRDPNFRARSKISIEIENFDRDQIFLIVGPSGTLSGPDGSRHSSDQHPKDVNSENSNYCPVFVWEFLSSRRQTPEVWKNFCVFTVFECLPHLPRNSRASRGRKFRFFAFSVFCGLKLLRACLKAPAFAGYVGDAQPKPQICPKFVPAIVFGGSSQGD